MPGFWQLWSAEHVWVFFVLFLGTFRGLVALDSYLTFFGISLEFLRNLFGIFLSLVIKANHVFTDYEEVEYCYGGYQGGYHGGYHDQGYHDQGYLGNGYINIQVITGDMTRVTEAIIKMVTRASRQPLGTLEAA